MPLPTPEQLKQLQHHLKEPFSNPKVKIDYGKVDRVKSALWAAAKQIGKTGTSSGAQNAVTMASGVGHVTVAGTAFFPIGSALAPWIGAAMIAGQADGIYSLHDLRDMAKKDSKYPCSCGKCAEGLQYVIDKKEIKIAIEAVSIFTAGVPALATGLNSMRKSFQSNRPKERYSKQFIESAESECLNAMAAIMLLCGKWSQNKAADVSQYIDPITCMVAEDGWRLLKSKW